MNNANLVVHPHFKLLVQIAQIELLLLLKGMLKDLFGHFKPLVHGDPFVVVVCERKHHVQESFFFLNKIIIIIIIIIF
jgi:hypothetical protein